MKKKEAIAHFSLTIVTLLHTRFDNSFYY